MRMIVGLTLLLAFVAGTGCQPAPQQDTSAADVEAINRVRDAYIAAESAGNAAAAAALFAEDAMYMPPNEPAISGRAAIEARLQQEYSTMAMELSVSPTETKVAGDIAYDSGSHTVRMTPKAGGEPIQGTGKHLVTLARQGDGSWKITNLIFNGDAPMPPMPPAQ